MTWTQQHLMGITSCVYEWNIDRFSTRGQRQANNNTNYLESPLFSENGANKETNTTWKIRAYTRGKEEVDSDILILYLIKQNEGKVCGWAQFTVLDSKRAKVSLSKAKSIEFDKAQEKLETKVPHEFLKIKECGYLLGDTLTIVCDLCICTGPQEKKSTPPITTKVPQVISKLSEDLEKLLQNKQNCDLKVIVDAGQEFKAHKAILAARSKVFDAMFCHQTDDVNLCQVKVTDIDSSVMEALLYYIYTDKVPKLNNFAKELLAAADKYDLEDLKEICEIFLNLQISIENAAQTLLLANRYHGDRLKQCSMEFIIKNAKDVVKTPGWQEAIIECPQLITEAFCAIAEAKKQ